MYRFERALKEERHLREMKMKSHSPSFSSTLLDEIYRSIDGCGPKREPEQSLRRETMYKKQSSRTAQITPQPTFSVEKRGSGEANRVADARRGHFSQELPRKPKYEPDLDSDALYFSSTSVSSDSSSGGFSFSDTESVRGAKTTAPSSCFAPFRLNPVRTRVAAKRDERRREANLEGKLKSGEASSSTSASSTVPSLSRPCLSKRTPSTRERLRSGAKRTVSFYPVSVIVDEDCRPCGHKCLHQEGRGEQSSSVSLSVPTAWRIGKSQPRKSDPDWSLNLKDLLMEKNRRFEENARELLGDYGENQKQGFELKGHCEKEVEVEEEDDDDDDDGGASCSSSDLFELDHLAAINDKYNAELPVYETTYFDKRRVSCKEYGV
ncbi:uncharacterized protein J3R85_017758 [Psidium guajava]|nr:uncharacterized protein J3R85_017758 [Psidium guajava]